MPLSLCLRTGTSMRCARIVGRRLLSTLSMLRTDAQNCEVSCSRLFKRGRILLLVEWTCFPNLRLCGRSLHLLSGKTRPPETWGWIPYELRSSRADLYPGRVPVIDVRRGYLLTYQDVSRVSTFFFQKENIPELNRRRANSLIIWLRYGLECCWRRGGSTWYRAGS